MYLEQNIILSKRFNMAGTVNSRTSIDFSQVQGRKLTQKKTRNNFSRFRKIAIYRN